MKLIFKSFWYKWRDLEKCVPCGGLGTMWKTQKKCSVCDGKGYKIIYLKLKKL